jgi:hypothetical protein
MIIRFISLATVIVTLDVYLQSQLYSNDPLFLFASNNLAVNIFLVVLMSLAVFFSFLKSFKSWYTYAVCTALAILAGGLGLAGTFFSSVTYSLPELILPLDYMFLLEAGVIFGLCSLSYKHAEAPFVINLPKLSALTAKFDFLFPRIPRSTGPARNRRIQPA